MIGLPKESASMSKRGPIPAARVVTESHRVMFEGTLDPEELLDLTEEEILQSGQLETLPGEAPIETARRYLAKARRESEPSRRQSRRE